MSGDLNADVRDAATSYRDPAGAVQQDKFVDKVIKGNSAVPNSTATVADLNADVRGEATDYRDPAIAVPQDKAAGECAGALPVAVGLVIGHSAVMLCCARHDL
jgi:hypothetical protein